ncbi:MAG: peptidoglycan bridge formation glycyltransferase FemA/FemB family protein [Patescibacteria group bacterium]
MFEFREIKSENEYKILELKPDASFTQSWFFGEWQKAIGRKVRRFEIINNTEIFGFLEAIVYNLVFSNNFIYVPHGPILMRDLDEKFWKQFREEITQIAKEENAVFVRFDPFLPRRSPAVRGEGGSDLSKYFKKTPTYAYHSSYFQPKYEWILDLNKTEEELLSEMHTKTRYNIRLAEKKNIKVEIVGGNFEQYFDDFYNLLEKTAKRDSFGLHPKIYYQNIFKTLNSENAFLAIARYENSILLVNLILLYGKTAYFVFGGSSSEFKNLMFSHLVQWEAIKEAKRREFGIYNFGGVDPSTSPRVNNRIYEKFGGISIFKKRFGGELLEYSDSYDIMLKPLWYFLYNLRKRFQFR